VLLAASLTALTACGGSSDGGADNAANKAANKAAQGNTKVATGGEDFSQAAAETAKLGSDAAPGEFPRTVKQSMGETKIDAKPQRVVVLDTGELDEVLSLGITPVGMATSEGANPIPSYLADKVKGVETIGNVQEINVEKVAELKPDLILGSQLRSDKIYSQLSEIAPTVFSIRPGFPWKENFALAADALGEETKAAEVMKKYDADIADLKSSVKGEPKVSLLRFLPSKIRIYGDLSLIGTILNDAGLQRPDNQHINELAKEISAENISEADGDYIFYSSYGTPDTTQESKVVAGAGWKALKGVEAGHAIRVNDDVWFLGLGPIGAEQIVSDLKAELAK